MTDAATNANPVGTFADELKKRLPHRAKALEKATGLSKSTVYEALGGKKLPSENTLRAMLVASGADENEVAEWLDRRAALTLRTDGDAPSAGQMVGRRWGDRAAGFAVGVVITMATVLLINSAKSPTLAGNATSSSGSAPSQGAANCPRVTQDIRTFFVTIRIVNTDGEGYATAAAPRHGCPTAVSLKEGYVTQVVCQVLNGDKITEDVGGIVRPWPVWDKLSSGQYVHDAYTDLPKGPRPALVDGLPAC